MFPLVPGRAETIALAALALFAFASNSILTRLALAHDSIDAASFTLVRLTSGALVLALLVRLRTRPPASPTRWNWIGPVSLFLYAAPFSFAYVRIGAAVGALVLFGVVQLTMIGWGLARGDRLSARMVMALSLAVTGLTALLLPSAKRPDPMGIALMSVAGVAWGAYSLRGKSESDPLLANQKSFLGSVPLALLVSAVSLPSAAWTPRGLLLAVASGAVASALGYAVWYRALQGLRAAQAAVLQLSVPVIAAFGAAVFLEETVGMRLVLCGIAVLGGTGLALSEKRRAS